MSEAEEEGLEGIKGGEVNLCLFPHVKDFLVIDLRRDLPHRPQVRLLNTDDILTEEFYKEIEKGFSGLLRNPDYPFSNLITLPQRLEQMLRMKTLEAILQRVNEGLPQVRTPQVAILVGTGHLLFMPRSQLARAVERLLEKESHPELVDQCVDLLEKLRHQERAYLRQRQQEHMKQAILGQSQEYLSLWERNRN